MDKKIIGWRRSATVLIVNIIFTLLFFFTLTTNGYVCKYQEISGAHRKNPKNGYWEVGWMPPNYKSGKTWIYPVEKLEGVIFKKFSKKNTGNTKVNAKDLGIDPSKGIDLPLLGIKGDLAIVMHRNVECPVRYYADDGSIALEWWTAGYYPSIYVGDKKQQDTWVKSKGDLALRNKIMQGPQHKKSVRSAPFDSRWLDTDKDGKWTADNLLKIRNYNVPVTLEYIMILPATVVSVPMEDGWKQGASVMFEYQTPKGDTAVSFMLDPAFMPDKGNLRIGFTGNNGQVYIVQNPGKGKEGIIVGNVPSLNGCLSIKPGTLRIGSSLWQPYDRIHVDKRKHIGMEGCPSREFDSFKQKNSRDWGYLTSYFVKPGTKFSGKSFPKRNPYTRIRRDMVSRFMNDSLRIAHKYGMRVSLDINGELTPANYIPDIYKGEILDPETGKFIKADFLDWTNPEAAKWEAENIKRRVRAFKGSPTYCQIHEGIGEHQSNNMSMSALKSFREFAKDPNIKFPVIPTSPKTERTTNKPDEDLLKKYTEWKLGYFRGKIFMLTILKAAYEALQGGNFIGTGYFGHVSDGGAYFVPYLAEAKETALLCPENVSNSKQGIFQGWLDAVRKSKGRIRLMPHSYPMLINGSTDRFIEWFEDVGLQPEVKGLIIGGGGLVPKNLYEALCAKHFGRGRMSVREAEGVIYTLKDKGIFYFDGYNTKKRKRSHQRNRSKEIFQMKTARRVKAKQKKIKVDGDLSDWKDLNWNRVEGDVHQFGKKKKLQGPDDLSFSFATAYDKDNFYCAFKVRDDKKILRTQTMSATGDEIEIFAGFVDDPLTQPLSLSSNAFQFRMIPAKGYENVYVGHQFLDAFPGTVSKHRITDDGYEIEAMIPWKSCRYTPGKGKILPLEIHLLDADTPAGGIDKTLLWNVFKGKKKPWSARGTEQWGLVELE